MCEQQSLMVAVTRYMPLSLGTHTKKSTYQCRPLVTTQLVTLLEQMTRIKTMRIRRFKAGRRWDHRKNQSGVRRTREGRSNSLRRRVGRRVWLVSRQLQKRDLGIAELIIFLRTAYLDGTADTRVRCTVSTSVDVGRAARDG